MTLAQYPESLVISTGKTQIPLKHKHFHIREQLPDHPHRTICRGVVSHDNPGSLYPTHRIDEPGKELSEEILGIPVQYDNGNAHDII